MKFIHISAHRMIAGLLAFWALFHDTEARFLLQKSSNDGPIANHDRALVIELEERLAGDMKSKDLRLRQTKHVINSTFNSLEKNSRGAIGGGAARYLIHRYFARTYGIQFKGLEAPGNSSGFALPVAALGNRIPSEVKDLLESNIDTHGLDLHDLAVVILTFEDIMSSDSTVRLRVVLKAFGINPDKIPKDSAVKVMETYAGTWLLRTPLSDITPENVHTLHKEVLSSLEDTPVDLALVLQDFTGKSADNHFSLARLVRAAVDFNMHYSEHLEGQCGNIREVLKAKMIRWGSGRVRLGDFYTTAGFSNVMAFSESPDWLRQKGCLDESDPEDPMVIIANYLHSPATCFNPTDYYGICCRYDPCAVIMDEIQDFAAGPHAKPDDILNLLATSENLRELFESQQLAHSLENLEADKLHEIAAANGGNVTLHGRLFAQYLHHVFPLECAYPHLPGAITSSGNDTIQYAHEEEILKYQEKSAAEWESTYSVFKSYVSSYRKEMGTTTEAQVSNIAATEAEEPKKKSRTRQRSRAKEQRRRSSHTGRGAKEAQRQRRQKSRTRQRSRAKEQRRRSSHTGRGAKEAQRQRRQKSRTRQRRQKSHTEEQQRQRSRTTKEDKDSHLRSAPHGDVPMAGRQWRGTDQAQVGWSLEHGGARL
eukprot:TRINITY_DN281_c0_g2_i3.p1 TRINITY_DN281_c0_g2~~TRINITY_DN281_c0_g2_i3.p1  ORF type:complete len:652 (-),score=101.33 TRINITY_DN281_c0_g2_i3:809-2764(-)